jgi:hypothetical protein
MGDSLTVWEGVTDWVTDEVNDGRESVRRSLPDEAVDDMEISIVGESLIVGVEVRDMDRIC